MRVFEALGTIHTKCCATCKHWQNAEGEQSAHGYCDMNTYPRPDLDTFWVPMLTLDLAICSKWEAKEDAE